jgi:sugar phosphate isomerase/epimerase
LRVKGELVLRVPSLPPGDDDAAPAVRLFVDRARAVAPDFELTADALLTVGEITKRLDGLPLAIELAAARLHTHSLAEVAAGLDERFSLLSSGYRTSTRHGSLRAAVSWSFDLLDERLQRLLDELSVFAGPFTAADAEAVCTLDPPPRLDDLTQLVERSLVTRTAGGRYALLETLRAFGTEHVATAGTTDALRDRHAQHFVDWVEDADGHLLDAGPEPLASIEAALPDLRAALDWLLSNDRIDLASRLIAALRDYGFFRPRPDVLQWADRVIAADPDGTDARSSLVHVASCYGAWMVGDVARSHTISERGFELAERADRPVPPEVTTTCGTIALIDGRLDDAMAWYARAVPEAVEVGDVAQRLFTSATEILALAYAGDERARPAADALLAEIGDAGTSYAAYTWYCAGEADIGIDDDRARLRFTRAIELAQETGASLVVGLAGASRASVEARVGDPRVAAEEYRWLIPHWRRSGVWSTQWTMLRSIAMLLERLGRHREAAVLEGAVRATAEGHRIYGADEAALAELSARLRSTLGEAGYDAARRDGERLAGDAAADLALRSLA